MSDSPVIAIPDVGGQEATANVLYHMLMRAAVQRRELQLAMIANGHSEDDPAPTAPGVAQTRADGTVNTYKLLLDEIDAQERRLAEAYPVEMDMVREKVESR